MPPLGVCANSKPLICQVGTIVMLKKNWTGQPVRKRNQRLGSGGGLLPLQNQSNLEHPQNPLRCLGGQTQ